MSEKMAEKKKREVEELEAHNAELMKLADTAACTHCGKLISSFEYLVLLPGFGWVECPGCGIVFCPTYVREDKLRRSGDINLIKPV